MDSAYISALAALSGSVVGALGSIATTWLTATAQERTNRINQAMTRRQTLYGDFIEEAAKVYSHALTSNLDDVSNLMHLYAVMNKLRLFAPANVVARADDAMERIIETYQGPNINVRTELRANEARDLDVLRGFSEACRKDLVS